MIRAMKESDWEAVAAIYKAAIDDGRYTFLTACPDYAEWDAMHHADCRLVLEEEGQVLAWCALSPSCPKPAYIGVPEVSIYVHPQHRGRGLGTKLLSALVEKSVRCGYWSLYAIVFADNAASCRIHEKCGFRYIGRREKVARDRSGQWRDVVEYEKRSDIE